MLPCVVVCDIDRFNPVYCQFTQLPYVLIFNRESSPEKHRKDNEVALGIPKEEPDEALVHTPVDANTTPKSIPSDTQHTREVPPSGATAASPGTRAHTPEEEAELFSTEYVDKLVASFWTKVDQKIEQAVSHYQASPQAGQQSNTRDNAHPQEAEAEDENNGKKRTLFTSSVRCQTQCLNRPRFIFAKAKHRYKRSCLLSF